MYDEYSGYIARRIYELLKKEPSYYHLHRVYFREMAGAICLGLMINAGGAFLTQEQIDSQLYPVDKYKTMQGYSIYELNRMTQDIENEVRAIGLAEE